MQEEIQKQEINLRDYIKIIVRYRKIVLTVFLISMILSVGMAAKVRFQVQRLYKISMFVDTGRFDRIEGGVGLGQIVEGVRNTVNETFFYWKIINGKSENIGLASMNATVEETVDSNVIQISTIQNMRAQEDGKKLLNKLMKILSEKYKKVAEKKKEEFENRQIVIEENIQKKENEIKIQKKELEIAQQMQENLLEKIEEIKNNVQGLVALRERALAREGSGYAVYEKLTGVDFVMANIEFSKEMNEQLGALERMRLNREIAIENLGKYIEKLKIQKEKLNFEGRHVHNLELLGKPKVSFLPPKISPKKTLIMGIILGFFASILAAFIMEFLEKKKTKKQF
jgi:uncharacterized protein involved in exopolysaccharide biosynthesis